VGPSLPEGTIFTAERAAIGVNGRRGDELINGRMVRRLFGGHGEVGGKGHCWSGSAELS